MEYAIPTTPSVNDLKRGIKMNENEAQQAIVDKVCVSRQKVLLAKAFFVANFKGGSEHLINDLLVHVHALMPEKMVFGRSVDVDDAVSKAADAISWRLAGAQAIWELIHANVFLPNSENLRRIDIRLEWTNVDSGQSSGWRFDEFSFIVPGSVRPAPSENTNAYQPLTDPDLYLNELDVPGLSSEVEDALRESVKCLRHELYTACLAMLGKASEGAWIELGVSLAKLIPARKNFDPKKTQDGFLSPFIGIAKKISDVVKLYEDSHLPKEVQEQSGIKLQDLRNTMVWADGVRESRNSIHYGAEPAMSNCYEKVAAFLIGAVPYLRIIYNVKNTADSLL